MKNLRQTVLFLMALILFTRCTMGNNVFDSPLDPFNSDTIPAAAHYHVQSVTKSGPFLDITAPSGHNYPQPGSSTRTFIELPMVIDQSDLAGSRPITITSSVAGDLTRVGTSPAAGEYRIPNTTNSLRGHVIEINSAEWGDTISFDYYGNGTVLNKNEIDPINETIGIIDHTSTKKSIYGFEAELRDDTPSESIIGIHTKIIEIGDWNMNSTAGVIIVHNLSDFKKIRLLSGIIRNDADTRYYPITAGQISGAGSPNAEAYFESIDSVDIVISRDTGGIFDNTSFDSTSYNRGWITIIYTD